MRYALPAFFLLCQVAHAGGDATPKTIFERWDVAFLGMQRSGYVHTRVTQTEEKVTGLVELRLKVNRNGQTIELGADTGSHETTAGAVTGVFMKQYVGKNQALEIQGKVNGKSLVLTLNQKNPLDPAPWNDSVIGFAKQQRLFKDKQIEPGDQFNYLAFEPSINLVVTVRGHAKDYEVLDRPFVGGKIKVLRVELKPDVIQKHQLPPLTIWLDEAGEQVRSETDVPSLGKLTLYKTTREAALAPVLGGASKVETFVKITQFMPRAHDLTSATYRIRVKGDADPAAGFSTDSRQKPGKVNGDTFDMTVRRAIVGASEKPGPEYLESSYYITSADAKVREHARKAVGAEADAWQKALKIERYVNKQMKTTNLESLAPADRVAQTMEGDCTEYAMLAAAMCRAEGVPSRTVLGLVYGEVRNQPMFGFHMWTEVWIRGQWTSIDATLGLGGIGAAHLKISDQSWHDESSLTPLLPTLSLLGRLSIDVLRTE